VIIPAETTKKEMEVNEVNKLLIEIHQFNHLCYDLDETQRREKFNKLHNRVKEIRKLISEMSREEKDKTDTKILRTQLPTFSWAYYGFSIKELVQDIVAIYRDIFETKIKEINDRFFPLPPRTRYRKVLFASERLNRFSSVLRDRGLIIKALCEDPDIVVDVMTNLPLQEEIKHLFTKVNQIIPFTDNLDKNIQIVGNGRYDVIVFPDLHMDGRTSFMSLCRLAPLHLTTYGHSDSSGSADYFITSKWFEPDNYQDNYAEKTIMLSSLNTFYSKTTTEEQKNKFKSGASFNLVAKNNYYLCSASPFKLGKEMIEIFKGIIIGDPNSRIILTKLSDRWDNPLFEVLVKEMGELIDRIIFMPRLSTLDLMNLNSLVKVNLEGIPFGNLNTSLECFELGLPVIVMAGNKINNRFTYGLYKKMGIESAYCANSVKEYIDLAIKIGTESTEEHNKRRIELIGKSECLFREEQSIEDWKSIIKSL